MDEDKLFAPPGETEEQDPLFAPPLDDELVSLGLKKREKKERLPVEETALAGLTGASIYGAQKGAEALIEKSPELAKDLAYAAIGGTSTPAGKNFLKERLKQLGEDASIFNEKDIGKRVLEEDLLGKFGLKGSNKMYDEVSDIFKKGTSKTTKLLETVPEEVNLENVLQRYKELVDKRALPTTEQRRDALRLLKQDAPDLWGKIKAMDAEELKKAIPYDPDIKEAGRNIARASKRQALRESVETAVEKFGGEELLKEFKALKKGSGEAGTIRDLLLQKSIKDTSKPLVRASDLVIGGVAGVGPAVARRGIKEYGAGVGAKALQFTADTAEKIAKLADKYPGLAKIAKTGYKALPIIGAGLTYGSARAEGATPAEAAIRTAADEVTDLVAIPKIALSSEGLGPRKGTLEYKLESGQPLTESEYKQLYSQDTTKENLNITKNKDKIEQQTRELSNNPEAEPFMPTLEKLQNSPEERDRDTALYNLMQQPAFRELLKKHKKENEM